MHLNPGRLKSRTIVFEGPRYGRVKLHQNHLGGTPRSGLKAKRTAPGIKIQATSTLYLIPEPIEKGLPHPIRGRTESLDLWKAEFTAAPCSPNHSDLTQWVGFSPLAPTRMVLS